MAYILMLAFCSTAPIQSAGLLQATPKGLQLHQSPAPQGLASKPCGDQPKVVEASRSASTSLKVVQFIIAVYLVRYSF